MVLRVYGEENFLGLSESVCPGEGNDKSGRSIWKYTFNVQHIPWTLIVKSSFSYILPAKPFINTMSREKEFLGVRGAQVDFRN